MRIEPPCGGLTRGRAQKAPDMTAMLPPDMLEANRLTREGRLTEATALLQRLLSHETPSKAPSRPVHNTPAPHVGRHPRVLDVDPETGEVTGPGPAKTAQEKQTFAAGLRSATELAGSTLPQMPEALRGFLDRVNQGGLGSELGGLTMRRPAQVPDPLPEGAQFVAGSFSSEAGTRGYKLY